MSTLQVIWSGHVHATRRRMRFWSKEWRRTRRADDLSAAVAERTHAQRAQLRLEEVSR